MSASRAIWTSRSGWLSLAAFRWVLGWLLSLPAAIWMGEVLATTPGHDSRLWDAGGLVAVEFFFRHGRDALPLLRWMGVGTVVALWAQLLPLAVVIDRLARVGRRPAAPGTAWVAVRAFPSLSVAFGVFAIAYLLLGGGLGLSVVWAFQHVGIDTWWAALQTGLTVSLLVAALTMLSMLHDAVRVGLVASWSHGAAAGRGVGWALSSWGRTWRRRWAVWCAALAMSMALWTLGAGLTRALQVEGVGFLVVAGLLGGLVQVGGAVARACWLRVLVVDFVRDERRRGGVAERTGVS